MELSPTNKQIQHFAIETQLPKGAHSCVFPERETEAEHAALVFEESIRIYVRNLLESR